MQYTINQKIKLKTTRQIVIAGIVFGIIYIFFSNGISEFYPFVNGAAVGIIIGLIISILELNFFARGAKKLRFIWVLVLRMAFYLLLINLVIFNVVVVSRMIRFELGYFDVTRSADFQNYMLQGNYMVSVAYTLIFAFSINFVRMISRKMGQGMLLSYIRGTYYAPVHQARIVMFLNIVNFNEIIEQLGAERSHQFLNDYFFDLTTPVIRNRGIIYEYVEDLMVVTWAIEKGLENARCIRSYFEISALLQVNQKKFQEKYGMAPKVQAALHTGSLVRAEIGEVKTQIVFHGDTMNTTARILGQCKTYLCKVLVSEQLIRMIGLPDSFEKKLVGEVILKGKEEALKLFEIIDNSDG